MSERTLQDVATTEYILPLADPRATLETVGGKGASLARLAAAGLPVPDGFHITTAAYRRFVAENDLQPGILSALEGVDAARPETLEAASASIGELFAAAQVPPDIAAAIATAYAALSGRDPIVAVRSSATAEDLPEASFAGQQETYLNLQGYDQVLRAVVRCWASLWTARAIGYRARQIGAYGPGVGAYGDTPQHEGLSLAVVVQALVPAEAAGVLFTANPVSGRRDQAMISAAWGLGEAIVGGLVTPDYLTVDKANGAVLERQTADKEVMTARVDGGVEQRPVPEALRRAPVLDDGAAAALTRLGVQIETLYAGPMDIEWALADGAFAILQARPITALPQEHVPESEPLPPTEWKLPRGATMAMRNNIVELMAEPLTPLFGTLGLAAINTSMGRLLSGFFGRSGLMPERLIITVNEYAFYNGSLSLGQMARILLGSVGIMKRMLSGAVERWTDAGRPRYAAVVERWQASPWRDLSASGILGAVRELSEASIDAYGALLSGVIPAAWISEGLFTLIYNTLIKRRDDPPAPTYLLGLDSIPISAEKSLYDLAEWTRTHDGLAAYLSRTPAVQIAAQRDQTPASIDEDDWHEWQNRFQAHLQHYGHTIYNLDFSNAVPADDPTPSLGAFKLFLSGQGANPHTRQRAAAEQRDRATQATQNRLGGLRLRLFRKLLAPARRYAPLREDGLADVGLAYPTLRQMLREVGRRFAEGAMVEERDDIFWLTQDEVEQAASRLDRGEDLNHLSTAVLQRKAIWRAARRVSPPLVLPQIRFLGIDVGERKKGRRVSGDTLKGVAASPGSVKATARVLHGPDDFRLMRPGDVLVAAITTPAWTPLFAMASAVVTDIGGPLSHGSIVAREYGIPAVMGTGVATRRIVSGQTITVDGSAGTVLLHKAEIAQTPPAGSEWKLPNPKGQYMRGSVVDFMPNPVSPLFATLGIPTIVRVGIDEVLGRLIRSKPQLPDYILTINEYAYMGASFTPRQWWWILSRMLPAFPRIVRQSLPLWRDVIRPRYVEMVARWQDRPPEAMSTADLWAAIRELNDAAMVHVASILTATTGASAGAEMLFTRVYDKMVRRKGDPAAPAFLMGYDSTPILAEKSLYDLAEWVRERPELAAHLLSTPSADLAIHSSPLSPSVSSPCPPCTLRDPRFAANRRDSSSPPLPVSQLPDWPEFQARLQAHLRAYGHIVYELDFARPLPLDDPAPMLETIKMYLRGGGANPHERQGAAEARRVQAVEETRARLRGLRRWAFLKTLGMGQAMAQVRENALADIGLGYPTLRRMFRELGGRFARAGAIARAEDIYWLQLDEVQELVAELAQAADDGETRYGYRGYEAGAPDGERGYGGAKQVLAERVAQRRARHEAMKRVIPPPMLPPNKKYMGFDMGYFIPATEESQRGGVLKGIAASAGVVTAPACVLHGPEDFGQMRPGDVLVAGATTPAWTPLFAMASAVVTDIGGPLSHGSIVAREYGIPAVMGTGVATRRIVSGQVITVDGGAGIVNLSPK